MGKDSTEAKSAAARNAICYLKALAKKKWTTAAEINVVSNPGKGTNSNPSEKLDSLARAGPASNGIKK